MTERKAAKFDAYADDYERLHARSVAVTGEETDYFARYKVDCLERAGLTRDARVLDFGCGIGNTTVHLVERFSVVHGFEPSRLSAERARARASTATIHDDIAELPKAWFSAVVLACVLHHVPPVERDGVLTKAFEALAPGGQLFIFEHNPYNPLTRRAVAQCAFDDDAILLPPAEQRHLLQRAGFVEVSLDYIVFFPRALAVLRRWEHNLRWCPLGAQIMARGTKPAA
jgi:SAM-dependent methyltransferase